MKIRRIKKLMAVILLGIALLAVGCAGHPIDAITFSQAHARTGHLTIQTPSSTPAALGTPSSLPSPSPQPQPHLKPCPGLHRLPCRLTPPRIYRHPGHLPRQLQDTVFPQESPLTVNNFIFLSARGFIMGLSSTDYQRIHDSERDPKGNGTGSPGYRFADELPPRHKYARVLCYGQFRTQYQWQSVFCLYG